MMDDFLLTLIPMPRGRWLARERARLGLRRPQVAAAIRRTFQTVAVLERSNGVIPPGWLDPLRALGMEFFDPVWPRHMPPYPGTAWAHEITTRIGLRHSPFRWSRHLGVTEEAVLAVLRSDHPVPPTWLLKLAEFGFHVPDLVRATLLRSASPAPQALKPLEGAESQVAAPSRATEPELVSAGWTEGGALSIKIGAPLLDQIPAPFKELLTLVLSSVGVCAEPAEPTRAPRSSE